MNKQYKASIVQFSKHELLTLSKKIGIESFIDTTHTGNFGYGGARNSVFLLTPVLREAYRQGKKTPQKVLEIPEKELRAIFHAHVLKCPSPNGTLLMIDDDMEIAEPNFFSHALINWEFNREYYHSPGWDHGRGTKSVQFIGLKNLLDNPMIVLSSNRWYDAMRGSGMSEFLSKPKFCINLPYGSEEVDSGRMGKWGSYMLQPSYHLGKMRLPCKELPTHFFVGLEEFLKSFVPYALNMGLIGTLLDPAGWEKRCVLPWNDKNFSEQFSSLGEVLAYIQKEPIQKEMQKKFWMNLQETFYQNIKNHLGVQLDELIHSEVDEILKEFTKQENLSKAEQKSLEKIGNLYKSFQKDAKILREFVILVVDRIKITLKNLQKEDLENWAEFCMDYPMNFSEIIDHAKETIEQQYSISLYALPFTKAIYLILHVVGAGEFNQTVRAIPKL